MARLPVVPRSMARINMMRSSSALRCVKMALPARFERATCGLGKRGKPPLHFDDFPANCVISVACVRGYPATPCIKIQQKGAAAPRKCHGKFAYSRLGELQKNAHWRLHLFMRLMRTTPAIL